VIFLLYRVVINSALKVINMITGDTGSVIGYYDSAVNIYALDLFKAFDKIITIVCLLN